MVGYSTPEPYAHRRVAGEPSQPPPVEYAVMRLQRPVGAFRALAMMEVSLEPLSALYGPHNAENKQDSTEEHHCLKILCPTSSLGTQSDSPL